LRVAAFGGKGERQENRLAPRYFCKKWDVSLFLKIGVLVVGISEK
jgi:hypothetical protein